MSGDIAGFGERLRAHVGASPDRWTECGTWAGVLVLRHTYVHPYSWDYSRQLGGEADVVVGVTALAACALHRAVGPAEPVAGVLLPRACALLADAATAVATIRAVPPPPPALEVLGEILAALPGELAEGTTDAQADALYLIGLARQALTPPAGTGPAVDDQVPGLARALAMTAELASEQPGVGPYRGAAPLALDEMLMRVSESGTDGPAEERQPRTEDERNQLLRAAALADRWLLAWGPDDPPGERVARADALADALYRHDTMAATPEGRPAAPVAAPDRRAYVRGQYAVYLAALNPPGDHRA